MDRTEETARKEKDPKEKQEEKRVGAGDLQVNKEKIVELSKTALLLLLKIVVLTLQAVVALLSALLDLLRSHNPPPAQRQGGADRKENAPPRQSWLDDWSKVRKDIYELPKIDLGFDSGKSELHPFVRDFVEPPSKNKRKDLPKWLR